MNERTNPITPQGYAVLRAELFELIDNERPRMVEIVHWAASNGDRALEQLLCQLCDLVLR